MKWLKSIFGKKEEKEARVKEESPISFPKKLRDAIVADGEKPKDCVWYLDPLSGKWIVVKKEIFVKFTHCVDKMMKVKRTDI